MLVTIDVEFSTDEQNSRFSIWFTMSFLLFLASMVYAAIFSLLGVVIQRRAMVFAVVYFVVVEVVCASIPAIIGKIAMSYHMFCLLLQWLGGWIAPDKEQGAAEFAQLWGVYPVWVHLSAIFGMTVLMLAVSAVIIRSREYITLEDAQF